MVLHYPNLFKYKEKRVYQSSILSNRMESINLHFLFKKKHNEYDLIIVAYYTLRRTYPICMNTTQLFDNNNEEESEHQVMIH